MKAKGHIVELPFQDESTLKRWILGKVKQEGKQMSEASAAYFLGKVGTDMQNIQGELEKLFCYTLHRDVITPEDINAVCISQIGNHIFEMVNAAAEKKQRKALDLYYELLALKEPPMRILFLLVRQYPYSYSMYSLCRRKDMEGKRLRQKPDFIHLQPGNTWSRPDILKRKSCGQSWRTVQIWKSGSRQAG